MDRYPAPIVLPFIEVAARTPDDVPSPIIGVPVRDPIFEVFGAVAEGGVGDEVIERGVRIGRGGGVEEGGLG